MYDTYNDDIMARFAHYKSLSQKKGNNQYRGNHIVLQLKKGSRRSQMRKVQVGERLPLLSSSLTVVSRVIVPMSARNSEKRCSKCGKTGHLTADCKSNSLTCFN